MTVDINVLLSIAIGVSFFLHYKQHKRNQEDKKVEYHTHNYMMDVIEEEEEWRM